MDRDSFLFVKCDNHKGSLVTEVRMTYTLSPMLVSINCACSCRNLTKEVLLYNAEYPYSRIQATGAQGWAGLCVIDRSSSTNGAGIQQAKGALLVKVVNKLYLLWIIIWNSFFIQLLFYSLRVDCYFNIVGFSSNYHVLFEGVSRKYNDDVLKFVQEYAKYYSVSKIIFNSFLIFVFLYSLAMEADLGASEIIEPLHAILKLPTIDGYLRQVFFLSLPAW